MTFLKRPEFVKTILFALIMGGGLGMANVNLDWGDAAWIGGAWVLACIVTEVVDVICGLGYEARRARYEVQP